MSYGIKIWDAAGNVSFDSTLATGGVCLGFFTVGTPSLVYTFPDFTSNTGVALVSGSGGIAFLYSTDNALGYLRFTFNSASTGLPVALFAK